MSALRFLGLCLFILPFGVARAALTDAPAPRQRENFDRDWRFAFGHPSDPVRDFAHATGYFSYLAKTGFGDGPAAPGFDDRAWRQLDLPHDWAVEAPFSAQGSHSHGYKAAGKGFPERSIGWYRKTFHVAADDLGRRICVEFDGIYRDARIWINGFYVGQHPSGYLGVQYDLTDYLNYDGDNVLVVRADASMEEGWFYEGAGIYRHVWLLKTDPVHIATWGTAITTDVAEDFSTATVHLATELRHAGRSAVEVEVEHTLLAPDGQVVAHATPAPQLLAPGGEPTVSATLTVTAPALWSTTSPQLYQAVTTLRDRATHAELDRTTTTFGIRTVRFDPDQGFFLNGQHLKLLGVNVHQDHAGVGTAFPDALQDFRLQRLKAFGVNAYRVAHQPPAPELLDACDRLGILVLDENRLQGSSRFHLDDLRDLIRRDRNHPSVIIWSVGNEEWEIEGNIKGARITQTMQDFARRLDPSRRTTVAISGGWGGSSTVADVVGYNYISQSNPDRQHADFPQQPGIGTEETTTQGTRGITFTDASRAHLAPLEHGDSGGNCEIGWTYYAARPFLAGLFFWTGFDYRGEPTPFGWPAVLSQYGLLDACGFPKASSRYLQAWWTRDPVLHLAVHWNWAGREGQTIPVVVYSNHDAVELLLNGQSLGRQTMPRNGHLAWSVPYAPGRLEARGYRAGELTQTTVVATTAAPVRLTLAADRPRIGADGRNIVLVTVGAVDAAGLAVPTADNLVSFAAPGGRILGLGNGDPGCHEPETLGPVDTLIALTNWVGRIAPGDTTTPADPAGLAPLSELGRYKARTATAEERYDLTGRFTLADDLPAAATVNLYLPSLGERCTVWLNGHEIARDVATPDMGPALPLTRDHLRPGLNRIQLLVTPTTTGRNRIPERNELGTVRIRQPAPPAQRSLFNGLAQVIVEIPAEATAPVPFTATAAGLASAALTLPIIAP